MSDPNPPAAGPTPEPQPLRDITLGDLLRHAVGEERSREHNRRVIERAAARSSMDALITGAHVAALEAGDPLAAFPAALRLRGYANREFGQDLTPEAVLRIRGRACEALDIDTAAADALPLARVVEVLGDATPAPGEADDLAAQFRWLRVTQVARSFALNPPNVTKLADAGTFVTNGMTGLDRRIDVLSVVRWVLARLDREAGTTDADGE